MEEYFGNISVLIRKNLLFFKIEGVLNKKSELTGKKKKKKRAPLEIPKTSCIQVWATMWIPVSPLATTSVFLGNIYSIILRAQNLDWKFGEVTISKLFVSKNYEDPFWFWPHINCFMPNCLSKIKLIVQLNFPCKYLFLIIEIHLRYAKNRE